MSTVIGGGLAAARAALDNGVVLISKEAHTVPAVTFQVSARAGSIYEPVSHLGLSHLTSRVLDRGTASRSSDAIAEMLDERGASLAISANRHVLHLTCTCLADDLEQMLELAADVFICPSFPEEEVDKRRSEVLNAIRQDEDNPAVVAVQHLFALLYPDHPYGRPAKGTLDTMSAIGPNDLVRFHDARFSPASTLVVMVGAVERERALEAGARAFGRWRKPAATELELPQPLAAGTRRERIVPMMNKVQADIAYGFTTITRHDPRYYALSLMNNALGQYGIGGRLGDSIRERQGMAYYVYSSFDANVVAGPLIVRAGVNPANVERAIASVDAEIGRMAREGLDAAELADCKQYLIGSIPRLLETNGAIATFLHTAEFFGLGLDHDLRLPALLDRVTLDEVNAAARWALDTTRAAVVVAGPYQPGTPATGDRSAG